MEGSMFSESGVLPIENLNPLEFSSLLETDKTTRLIDCREEYEWNEGHLENATLMPLSQFTDQMLDQFDKNQPVAIYCHSGHRSMNLAYFLVSKGFKKVINLQGGILFWVNHGLPISYK